MCSRASPSETVGYESETVGHESETVGYERIPHGLNGDRSRRRGSKVCHLVLSTWWSTQDCQVMMMMFIAISARDYSSKPDGEYGRFNHWFCTKERKDCQVRPDLRGRLVYIVNICVASQSFHTNQPITQGCLSQSVLQPFGFRHQRSLLQIAHVHRLFQLGVCPRERGCHASFRNHCHQ